MPPHKDSEDSARDVAFEAANCLELRVSGCDPSGEVILCACILSKPPDSDDMNGTVCSAIATPVQPVPDRFPGRSGDWADTARCGEACFGLQAVGVIACREQQLCRTVHADCGLRNEFRSEILDEGSIMSSRSAISSCSSR